MEARVDPLATFYRQQPARGPSAVRCSNQQPELSPPHPSCPAALASLTAPRRLGRGQNLRRDRAPAALGPRGRTWTAATTSSLVPLPSPFPACPPLLLLLRLATLIACGAVDDGRTPGRKAGWTDGLTDEERADRDFYDPKADDDDERWVVENLKHAAITAASSPGQPAAEAASSEPGIGTGGAGPGGAGPGSAGAGGAGAGEATEGADGAGGKRAGRKVGGVQLPPSDAVLSCPACFTLICLDCQRHSNFGNQWRALFAQNVTVLTEQRLTVGAGGPGEWYCKVQCEYCEAEVGVRDQDEVFHFFDVFPS